MSLLLVTLLLGAEPVANKSIVPIQADLSIQGALGDRSAGGLALYVGGAVGKANGPWATPFVGGGFEMVYAWVPDPYRTAFGLQLRAGYSWSPQTESPHDVHPDAMVYLRFTPFFGSPVGPGDESLVGVQHAPRKSFQPGVRFGIGATVPFWTRLFLFNGFFSDEHDFFGQTAQVFTTLLLLPAALLNHVELIGEVVDAGPWVASVVLRLGTGF